MLNQLIRVTPEKAMKLTCHLIMKDEEAPTLQGSHYWRMYAYESVREGTCMRMHVHVCECMCECVCECLSMIMHLHVLVCVHLYLHLYIHNVCLCLSISACMSLQL